MSRQQKSTEAHSALTVRVPARLRPLREHEAPPDAAVIDRRMVEYGTELHGMVIPDWFQFADPIHDLSLIERFSYLFGGEQLPGDEEVVDFYATFGPVNETAEITGGRWPAWLGRLEPQAQQELLQDPMTRWSEPLWWLHDRGRELRLTFQVYQHLKAEQSAGLRALFGAVPAGKRVIGIELVAGRIIRDVVDEEDIGRPGAGSVGFARQEVSPVAPAPQSRPLTDEECIWLANRLLAQQLNIGEEGSRRQWATMSGPEGAAWAGRPSSVRLAHLRSTQNLTAALYLQVGEVIEREAPLRQCQGCQRIFLASRPDRLYCSPQCGDAARQRTYYRAKVKQPLRPRTKRRRR